MILSRQNHFIIQRLLCKWLCGIGVRKSLTFSACSSFMFSFLGTSCLQEIAILLGAIENEKLKLKVIGRAKIYVAHRVFLVWHCPQASECWGLLLRSYRTYRCSAWLLPVKKPFWLEFSWNNLILYQTEFSP